MSTPGSGRARSNLWRLLEASQGLFALTGRVDEGPIFAKGSSLQKARSLQETKLRGLTSRTEFSFVLWDDKSALVHFARILQGT